MSASPAPRTAAPAPAGPGRGDGGGSPGLSRRTVVVAAVVCALVAAVFLGWVAWGMLQPRADGEVGLFEATHEGGVDGVELVLEVTRPVGSTAVCTIEALGEGFTQVGLVDVTVEPADTQVTRVQVTMATSEPARLAMVRSCRLL